jgi:5'-nucleotidase (lipoprotein e(P4) family)
MPTCSLRSISLLTALALVIACSPVRDTPKAVPQQYTLGATLWFQTSAEARALCYQAYHLAQLQLDRALRDLPRGAKGAVVLDIDETVLDNSPHQAKLLQTGESYPAYWDEWVQRAEARALPGAAEFLRYAHSRGVALFYVSNRNAGSLNATLTNLRAAGFPQADSAHVLLRGTASTKEPRRQEIGNTHRILLLVGDNLADFSDVFERATVEERAAAVDRLRSEFGSRFILLPNPIYGDWDRAVLQYRTDLSESEQNTLRMNALRSF